MRTTCLFVFIEEPYNVIYIVTTPLFVLLLVRHVLANATSLWNLKHSPIPEHALSSRARRILLLLFSFYNYYYYLRVYTLHTHKIIYYIIMYTRYCDDIMMLLPKSHANVWIFKSHRTRREMLKFNIIYTLYIFEYTSSISSVGFSVSI